MTSAQRTRPIDAATRNPLVRALHALEDGRAVCLSNTSGLGGSARWMVATSAEAAVALEGTGELVAVARARWWTRRGVDPERLELEILGGDAPAENLDPATLRGWLSGGGEPPVGLRCLCARPGGVMVHPTAVVAAHELGRELGHDVAFLRAVPPTVEPTAVTVDLFELVEAWRADARPATLPLPVEARLPTRHGTFRMFIFENPWTGQQDVAMVRGDVTGEAPVLVRMHSECFTGDIMGSTRCDCGPQLDAALARVVAEGRGIVLYLRQEGRGIGLYHKLRAYVDQDRGLDTVDANHAQGFPADMRDYAGAAAMLRALGVSRVRLMTNNPSKLEGLEAHGVEIVERVPHTMPSNAENRHYLETKRVRMRHLLQPMERVTEDP